MSRLMYVLVIALMLSAQYALSSDLNAQVKFTPEKNPIVIATDLTVGPGEVVAHGPWFLFKYSLTNNSQSLLKLNTYTFTVNGTKNGKPVVKSYFYETEPGTYCDAESPCEVYDSLYIDELPENDNRSYDVKIEITGWFEGKNGKIVQNYLGLGSQTTR